VSNLEASSGDRIASKDPLKSIEISYNYKLLEIFLLLE
jgi:hypothetical protein